MNFSDLSLPPRVLSNLEALGHRHPTPIQEQMIPLAMEGRDIIGMAQTGSGKTAAYCLPIIAHLLEQASGVVSQQPRVLILVPTRELANQIEERFQEYGRLLELSTLAVFGGVGQVHQVKALKRGVEILIATPGRLLDLLSQKHLSLQRVDVFVLDEADRMLDMGFLEDIRTVLSKLPTRKQSIFLSATMPPEILKLSARIMKDPTKVEIQGSTLESQLVKQRVIFSRAPEKFQLLRTLLSEQKSQLVLVFAKTKNQVDKIVSYLRIYQLSATAIHGDKLQTERERAIDDFKPRRIGILVATDVASRGLDIPEVNLVINFELPLEAESYVHRIGRTGRAGKYGEAVSFCEESEKPLLEKIQILLQAYLPTTTFKGKPEQVLKVLSRAPLRKVTPPTPGKSQEKLPPQRDHSKRQRPKVVGEKVVNKHPGFRNKKKR